MKSSWRSRTLVSSPTYIGLCLAEKAFKKECRRLGVSPPPFVSPSADATTHYFVKGHRHCAIVCIKGAEKQPLVVVVGMLVHEAAHVWQDILQHLGEHNPSSEFEAYSLQAISQQFLEKFFALGGKVKDAPGR